VTTDPLFFRDLSYVLIAAVAGGFVARLLRQPLIVGFVLAGMVIGNPAVLEMLSASDAFNRNQKGRLSGRGSRRWRHCRREDS
jgi:Kef-type K+ transport system membrane component KefB